MTNPDVIDLSQLTTGDTPCFGGKATHLAALVRDGVLVPPGFAISSRAFQRFIDHHKLLTRINVLLKAAEGDERLEADHLTELRTLIRETPLLPELSEALHAAYGRLRGTGREFPVAVRSSARSEDSSDASFAGQYDSVLNVQGFDALCDAVREVWASYFADRAVRYRRQRRQTRFGFDMGLLVQAMVDAKVAGVLFTVNPMSGARDEMLAEAGFGLGEAFVSGQLSPDTFFLTRPTHRFSRTAVQVRERRIEPKRSMLVSAAVGSGQLELVDIPEERQLLPALTDVQATEIGREGLRIERLFGAPQDIEWAIDAEGRLNILQARPITTLIARPHQRRAGLLWTQRFSGERWTEPATPLGWSIMQPILNHFIYFDQVARDYLQGTPPTRVIHGYPYFNITIFRHLLWKVPGYAPPQFILEFFPRDEQEEILAAPYILPNMALVRGICAQVWRERRWRRYHWNFLTNHQAWDALLPRFQAAIEALPDKPGGPLEARLALETGREWIREYIKIHLLSLLFANLYYQLLAGLLRRWMGEGSDKALSELMAEPEGNKTVETNRALWSLAALARSLPAVGERLTHTESPPLDTLEHVEGGAQFIAAFEQFLNQYGHRSSASWEIFSPRWCDEPGTVIQMIRSYLETGEDADPISAETRRRTVRVEAEARLLQRIGSWHPWRRMVLVHVLGSTQRYMTLRENQRFYFDRLLLKIKRSLSHLGEQWAAEGLLESPRDLTLLTLEEVDQILDGQIGRDALARTIAERRETYANDMAAHHPVFLEGDGETLREAVSPSGGRMLSGLGISPGRITGTARVITQLKEMNRLRRGDILVTRATDPGWTPLFLTAGGLITELGSLLSHGAVVAREYNLPAVVNIADATSVLRDGQEITVDGSRGLVYLH